MTEKGGVWTALERWSTSAFMLGGLLLAVDAGFVAANIVTGTESYLIQGQAFVAAGWAAALLGMLGLYPELSHRSRWLSRAGAVFAVIGVVTFAVMAVAFVGPWRSAFVGFVWFIPGVFIGSLLGFGSFSVASLRTGFHSRSVGFLLLLPAALFLTSLLQFVVGVTSARVTLVIVIGEALAMLAIGYVLRDETPRASNEPTGEPMM